MNLGEILAKETHEALGKILAGDDHDATARPFPGGPARLLPKTSAGPQPDPHLPRLHCCSHAAASPPARQTPAWRHAASRPTRQAPAWWHADLREDSATAPTQQLASVALHARQCGRATKPGGVATAGMSFLAVPDKARRARRQRIKCVCPTVPEDRLNHCMPFHLLCATMVTPFDYKRRPEAYWERIRIF